MVQKIADFVEKLKNVGTLLFLHPTVSMSVHGSIPYLAKQLFNWKIVHNESVTHKGITSFI